MLIPLSLPVQNLGLHIDPSSKSGVGGGQWSGSVALGFALLIVAVSINPFAATLRSLCMKTGRQAVVMGISG